MDSTQRDAAMRRVWQVVRSIPHGATLSYGEVARQAGLPRRARWVAVALNAAPASARLPWHRVIGAGQRIAFPRGTKSHARQAALLRSEGHDVAAGRLRRPAGERAAGSRDLDALLWRPRR
jgi:methylated-DNA-protein-cysteine methyltransferase-like protein